MRKVLFTLFVISTLTSCSEVDVSVGPQRALREMAKPTIKEVELLESARQKISAIAAEYGYFNSFNSLPVLITEEDPGKQERIGYCQQDKKGNGIAIVLNRSVFAPANSSQEDLLFAVLLHEIGHCYFKKSHNYDNLHKEGYSIYFSFSGPEGDFGTKAKSFPISIMSADEDLGFLKSFIEFQRYYVAELLGIERLQTLEDLLRFPSVTIAKNGNGF